MIRGIDSPEVMPWGVVAMSVVAALIFAVWPLSDWAQWLRPEFAAVIVIYWVVAAPFHIGMFFAWCLGLSMDLLEGVVLSQNALGLTVLAYVCFLLHQRLRMFGVFEQAASVFVLVGIHQLIGYWVHGLTGGSYHTLAFLIPALISALIWPLVRLSLDRLRL